MLKCRLETLSQWPQAPTLTRKKGQFQVDYGTLLTELDMELDYLDATDITVQMAVPITRLKAARNAFTGWPKSETKTTAPGVVLTFESRKGPLLFACDTYEDVPKRVGWQDNLRALSLTLTALRAINRYGATQQEQQYQGFTALPPPSAAPVVDVVNIRPIEAAMVLTTYSGIPKDYILDSPEAFQKAYREAAKRAHPDAGGSHEEMAQVNAAAETLRDYHRL